VWSATNVFRPWVDLQLTCYKHGRNSSLQAKTSAQFKPCAQRGWRSFGTLTCSDYLPFPARDGSDGSLHYGSVPRNRSHVPDYAQPTHGILLAAAVLCKCSLRSSHVSQAWVKSRARVTGPTFCGPQSTFPLDSHRRCAGYSPLGLRIPHGRAEGLSRRRMPPACRNSSARWARPLTPGAGWRI
jgi:hypothetical protein